MFYLDLLTGGIQETRRQEGEVAVVGDILLQDVEVDLAHRMIGSINGDRNQGLVLLNDAEIGKIGKGQDLDLGIGRIDIDMSDAKT